MSEQKATATVLKGWHLGGCERHGDEDPAGGGCSPNCPRSLHTFIEELQADRDLLAWALRDFSGGMSDYEIAFAIDAPGARTHERIRSVLAAANGSRGES